jgi:rhodanese-related sulfurtransferase
MKMNLANALSWLSYCSLAYATAAMAVSPAQVQQRTDSGEKLTLIDLRPANVFAQGHIPNAINIPASLVPLKQLPPLGKVVVYDEGLGHDSASAAALALNQKRGITAEVMDGGYASWQTARASTTQVKGMQHEDLQMITYDQLKRTTNDDVVLVDLRTASSPSKSQAQRTAQPLTDLQAEFPKAKITRSPFENAKAMKLASAGSDKAPLVVLIDSGDGAAQAMARALKANGVKRYVILAGGEEILSRKGQPGLQRAAGTISVQKPLTASPSNNQ